MKDLFSDDDLKDLFAEFEEATKDEEIDDPEMEASERRFKDIIQKHKND